MKQGARLWFAGAAMLGVLVSCAASDDAGSSSGFGPGQGSGSGGSAGLPGGKQVPEPEQELDEAFQAPVVSGPFVWSANPTSGAVALIDARSFRVKTLPAGAGPTYLAALPARGSGARAVVINVDSEDATVLVASQDGDVSSEGTTQVHPGANAWATTADGRFAIAWTNAMAAANPDPSEGFQDITVLDLRGDTPISKRLSVGFRPDRVFVDDDDRYVYFVTDSGIDVVDLLSDAGPIVEREVALSANPARDTARRDVNITPDGTRAFVSRQDQSYVTIVDLVSGQFKDVTLPGVVTDLDLSVDASLAVAIVQTSTSADPSAAGAGAGGQGGQEAGGSEGGGTDVGTSGGGGLATVGGSGAAGEEGMKEPPAENQPRSLAVLLPVDRILASPEALELIDTDERFASVELGRGGDVALLYQNGVPSTQLTLLKLLDDFRYRTVDLKLPVFSAKSSPSGEHAVVLLNPPAGSAKPGAFAVLPVANELPAAIQGTAARTVPLDFAKERPAMVAMDDAHALVTVSNQTDVHVAYLIAMPALTVDVIPLASAPLPGASGIVAAANQAFVAQQHPEGRITFIDLSSGEQHTLTGFELSAQVKP